MTKSELRKVPASQRTSTCAEDIYGVFSSSGTTGKKTFYIYNKNDKRVHEEFIKSYFGHLGIGPRDLGAILAPVGSDVMTNTMMWQYTTVGAGYTVCPKPRPADVLELINEVPITVISTRPTIAMLPYYEKDIAPHFRESSVRILALGGGFMSRSRRAILEELWGAECYNLLGMSEMFGPMATECHCHDGFHYRDDYLLIEVVNPETGIPVEPGEPGVAVYTTLWEKGFPLLRYWTDDYVYVSQEPCPCGWQTPRIHYLGRLGDCLRVGSGFVFPEAVEDILFEHGLTGEYQINVASQRNVVICAEQGYEDYDYVDTLECLRSLFVECDVQLEIVERRVAEEARDERRFRIYS